MLLPTIRLPKSHFCDAARSPDPGSSIVNSLYNHFRFRCFLDEEEATDAVQEVFLEMWRALREGRIEQPEEIERFLWGIARNHGFNRMKREHLAREARRRLAEIVDVSARDTTLLDLDKAHTLRKVANVLATYPTEHQIIVYLYLVGYRSAEIAEVVEKEAANCRQILHRTLTRLSRDLQGDREERKERYRGISAWFRSCTRIFLKLRKGGKP